jgi:hypothetical protein
MSALTASEECFLEYCELREYQVRRIPPAADAGRFPDYQLTASSGSIIVEIKEFTPNEDDELFAETLKEQGRAGYNRSIAKRVRGAIMDAAPQLRRYRDTPWPEILLLYDNIVIDGHRNWGGNDHLDPLDLAGGMFGVPVMKFWPDPLNKPADASDVGHGGKRELTNTRRLYIGAVGVLNRTTTTRPLQIDFFHNPFSTKPVWPRYFLHPDDRHYIMPDHPDKCGWEWSEFVGDRKTT